MVCWWLRNDDRCCRRNRKFADARPARKRYTIHIMTD